MAVTQYSAAEIQALVVEAWSDIFMQELREKLMLGALVNKDYSGQISNLGDSVKVSQINAPTGQLLTVGVDADSFDSEALSSTQVEVKADKRAVASYEFEDTVQLMTQLGNKDSEIRAALLFAVSKQINDYLYTLVAPSASAPDHVLISSDMNAAQIAAIRKLAAQAKWDKSKGWWLLCDPSYYSDILNAQTLTSQDYVGGDLPIVGGQVVNKRFGFNILEDDSRPEDYAIAFHPDFMHLVMKTQPTFKVSDLHSHKKFGYVISVDQIFGAKLGIQGALKHIKVTAS
ncbi:hypothetical protein EKK58_08585 [Candidatus Dependentiae bacterium]|nr:MAG: hypothetical protein EKK58_08585 [Candidatus Dependentiae bacterium]